MIKTGCVDYERYPPGTPARVVIPGIPSFEGKVSWVCRDVYEYHSGRGSFSQPLWEVWYWGLEFEADSPFFQDILDREGVAYLPDGWTIAVYVQAYARLIDETACYTFKSDGTFTPGADEPITVGAVSLGEK